MGHPQSSKSTKALAGGATASVSCPPFSQPIRPRLPQGRVRLGPGLDGVRPRGPSGRRAQGLLQPAPQKASHSSSAAGGAGRSALRSAPWLRRGNSSAARPTPPSLMKSRRLMGRDSHTFHSARCERMCSWFAFALLVKRSVSGFHLSLAPVSMAMCPIWHMVTARWPISAGTIVSLRPLTQLADDRVGVLLGGRVAIERGPLEKPSASWCRTSKRSFPRWRCW